jgi:hypothetical protein
MIKAGIDFLALPQNRKNLEPQRLQKDLIDITTAAHFATGSRCAKHRFRS